MISFCFFKLLILRRIEAGNLWRIKSRMRRLVNPKDIKLHILGSELAMEWFWSKRLDSSATLNWKHLRPDNTSTKSIESMCCIMRWPQNGCFDSAY